MEEALNVAQQIIAALVVPSGPSYFGLKEVVT
jgi:hypothetical protein